MTSNQSNAPEVQDLDANATLSAALAEIQEIALQLYQWNWIDTTGGSLSVRLPQDPDLFAMTPTHSGFRDRWNIRDSGLVVLDKNLNLHRYSTSQYRAHPSAVVHRKIFDVFPEANSIIHTHAPHSLVFACAGKAIEPLTLHSKILGSVPCFSSDADEIRDRSGGLVAAKEERMTSGVEGYAYAHKHFLEVLPQIENILGPRRSELQRHGLAFNVYKHGIFTFGRNLNEAYDNLIRVERNAQVQILSKAAQFG